VPTVPDADGPCANRRGKRVVRVKPALGVQNPFRYEATRAEYLPKERLGRWDKNELTRSPRVRGGLFCGLSFYLHQLYLALAEMIYFSGVTSNPKDYGGDLLKHFDILDRWRL